LPNNKQSWDSYVTFHDLIDKGMILARELGEYINIAFNALYEKDTEVISKYVLILVLAGLLIFGIRLLSDEIQEYRRSRGNESGKLPWYLRDSSLFLAIVTIILLVYAVIFVLI
jgi:hypothetical protein